VQNWVGHVRGKKTESRVVQIPIGFAIDGRMMP
jgi:hypothetical protein